MNSFQSAFRACFCTLSSILGNEFSTPVWVDHASTKIEEWASLVLKVHGESAEPCACSRTHLPRLAPGVWCGCLNWTSSSKKGGILAARRQRPSDPDMLPRSWLFWCLPHPVRAGPAPSASWRSWNMFCWNPRSKRRSMFAIVIFLSIRSIRSSMRSRRSSMFAVHVLLPSWLSFFSSSFSSSSPRK